MLDPARLVSHEPRHLADRNLETAETAVRCSLRALREVPPS